MFLKMFLKGSVESSLAPKVRQPFVRWLSGDIIRQAIQRTNLYIEIMRERQVLAKLSDAELRDIGIHRADADAESRRAFNDVPADRIDLIN